MSVQQMAAFLPPRAALERQTLSELSKLFAPAELAGDWHQILAYRRTLARELDQLGRDAQANNTQAITALFASKALTHNKLSSLATRAGFRDCSHIG